MTTEELSAADLEERALDGFNSYFRLIMKLPNITNARISCLKYFEDFYQKILSLHLGAEKMKAINDKYSKAMSR